METQHYSLKIQGKSNDVPLKLIAQGKHPIYGDVCMVMGSSGSVVAFAGRQDFAFLGKLGWSAPGTPKPVDSLASTMQAINALIRTPGIETPETYINNWQGVLSVDVGANGPIPTVTLQRKVSSYATIALEGSAAGWKWGASRVGKWFTGPTSHESKTHESFQAALDGALRFSLQLVQEACGQRDTRRRRTFDPTYAEQHPAKPQKPWQDPSVERVGEGPKVPDIYAPFARWSRRKGGFEVSAAGGWFRPDAASDIGSSNAPAKIRKMIEAVWKQRGAPAAANGGVVSLPAPVKAAPKPGAGGSRKAAFKLLRARTTDPTALVAAGGQGSTLPNGVQLYAFGDKSVLALYTPAGSVPVKLLRGKWTQLDNTGKAVAGGWVYDVKAESKAMAKAAKVAERAAKKAAPGQAKAAEKAAKAAQKAADAAAKAAARSEGKTAAAAKRAADAEAKKAATAAARAAAKPAATPKAPKAPAAPKAGGKKAAPPVDANKDAQMMDLVAAAIAKAVKAAKKAA